MNNLSILLSTFNSSRYIEEQLNSLVFQKTAINFLIYIRDDGSTDNTPRILERYQLDHDKIVLFKDDKKNLGACLSFMHMLSKIDSEYYMFCDHDDIWLPNKIDISYNALKRIEFGLNNKPLVLHTDMTVVDKNMKVLHDSFWKYSGIFPKLLQKSSNIQVLNCVTGCAMIFNREARDASIPFPDNIPMHDWWIAIKTAQGGSICSIPVSTILYRQHNNNVVGAKSVNIYYFLRKVIFPVNLVNSYLKHLSFLKSIDGISIWYYIYFKIYYSIYRIVKSKL